MNEARCTYYKEFIDENSSNQAKLFRASKSLLNLQAEKSLPLHSITSVLANERGEYFIHKKVAMRSKLAGDSVSPAVTKRAPFGSSSSGDLDTLSEFQPVRNMAVAFMKTCTLEPLRIPSSILLVCIEELLPVISRMANVSLEHGYFADDWKRAVVYPLLKTSGLQLINKNFRSVSNLQFTPKLIEKAVAVQITGANAMDCFQNCKVLTRLELCIRHCSGLVTSLAAPAKSRSRYVFQRVRYWLLLDLPFGLASQRSYDRVQAV